MSGYEDDSPALAVSKGLQGGLETAAATSELRKCRVAQEMIDLILAWDVSDYVFSTPDNMDDMPISEESKKKYRDERKQTVAFLQKRRRIKREMQKWVMSELEKHGYVQIETPAEVLEKHQLEEFVMGESIVIE